jgi:2-C-methyl-D-erythritol 4-phosphate cytidylyltransferase
MMHNPGSTSGHQEHLAGQPGSAATGAVVLAAGLGERLGRGVKSLVQLSGSPILAWTLGAVAASRCVRHIVVTAPVSAIDPVRRLAEGLQLPMPVHVVAGGASRQDSARKGVEALPSDLMWAAVTDAARPLQAPGLIDFLVARLTAERPWARAGRGAITAIVPTLPLPDTIHRVTQDGLLDSTLDRNTLRAAQTPQVACRACLAAAHRAADLGGLTFTDDAAVVRWAGGEVLLAPGDPANLKVTVPADLAIAEAFLAQRGQGPPQAVPAHGSAPSGTGDGGGIAAERIT